MVLSGIAGVLFKANNWVKIQDGSQYPNHAHLLKATVNNIIQLAGLTAKCNCRELSPHIILHLDMIFFLLLQGVNMLLLFRLIINQRDAGHEKS